jgi:hypothetical protein
MLNYSLSAERLLHASPKAAPNTMDYILNRDSTTMYWFFTRNERYGVDEVLAWLSAVSGLSAIRAFMSLMLTTHLVYLVSGAGLAYRSSQDRGAGVLACVLLAASSLVALGVMYQLLGQVCGLALAFAALNRLCSPPQSFADFWGSVILTAIVVAAAFMAYPEVLAFVIGSAVVWYVVSLFGRGLNIRTLSGWLAVVTAAVIVLLNGYLRNVSWVIAARVLISSGVARRPGDIQLFPYYLVPTGLANFAGSIPVSQFPGDPLVSVGIIFGAAFIALALFCVATEIRRNEPAAIATAVCGIVLLPLLFKKSDFGIFKLAMYSLPFALITLSVWFWAQVTRMRGVQA